jgi:AraC-like DNA-binding protein/ligand-binding sensor protein
MKSSNTIQRQKAAPILEKARTVIRHYGKAANCLITVLDQDYNVVEASKDPNAMFFCSLCTQYCGHHCKKSASGELPCSAKHVNAIQDSCRLGGSYIYLCDLGFLFWTSPFFSGEQFAGALIGSGALGVTERQAVEKIQEISRGEVSQKQIKQYLDEFSGKSYEDVKAMAQMMSICAERISVKNVPPEMLLREEYQPLSAASSVNSDDNKETDKEAKLLAALRRGDRDEARKIINELTERHKSGGSFEALQMRVIELTAFLSRAAAGADDSCADGIPDEYDKYLKKTEEAHNAGELIEILDKVIYLMAGKMFSFQGVLHSAALRKAERFIWENYSRKISLKEIAGAAGLSAPYFSTIFREEMGIHLSHYLNRLRVAKAASMLVETAQSINRIATVCGFEDQSWFSKIFKSHTGVSPGKYREQGGICGAPGWLDLKGFNTERTV